MRTFTSTSGKKAVNVRYNAVQEHFTAAHVQIDSANQREQLIQMKSFSNEAKAINWAKKQLN
ncbi:hypothetical protein [Christiangramia crocea]|uniref:Uncharacterized protein n=1 Tax=Christiangramia crocea TaxID=2904124 RepID=A0A9X1UV78_9FLAO|nr:hypothetical protein [Gramella crocea]MCG9971017.1 hypothetical protein [Gramella crocea]